MTTATPTLEPYILLRAALSLFQKMPVDLEPEQLQQVQTQAENETRLENIILASKEAGAVIVPEEELHNAFQEVRNRYDNESDFVADLEKNDLNIESLQQALYRQCKVNSVMELVAAKAQTVEQSEVESFYQKNQAKFTRLEHREAAHILISINPEYPENKREESLKRMVEIQEILKKQPYKFKDLALKHSECPTAMQGGVLGKVTTGKLYPELDKALFELEEGQISEILESEIGYHILLCQKIYPQETMPVEQAFEKIRELLTNRYRQNHQRQWLASLTSA